MATQAGSAGHCRLRGRCCLSVCRRAGAAQRSAVCSGRLLSPFSCASLAVLFSAARIVRLVASLPADCYCRVASLPSARLRQPRADCTDSGPQAALNARRGRSAPLAHSPQHFAAIPLLCSTHSSTQSAASPFDARTWADSGHRHLASPCHAQLRAYRGCWPYAQSCGASCSSVVFHRSTARPPYAAAVLRVRARAASFMQ